MHSQFRIVRVLVVMIGAVIPAAKVSADVIKLKNGGEVRGILQGDPAIDTTGPVIIKTQSGSVVSIERSSVQFFTKRALVVEEHETRAKTTPATIEAQWEIAEWCRKHGLKTQREEHLRKILEIDPDHKSARAGLGYSKYDGKWMTRDEWHQSRGLVKHKGKYITPEELLLLQEHEAVLERERAWFRKVFVWKTWLTGSNLGRQQVAAKELSEITDPDAVSALARYLRNDSNDAVRRLYVSTLTQMQGGRPGAALAYQALYDSSNEIRYAALNGISEPQYAAAIPQFVRALKDDSVEIVRRAGDGLKRVGNQQTIPALIDAIVTTHRYKVRVQDNSRTTSFGTNGSFGAGQSVLPPQIEAMMRAGQFPNGVIVNNPQLNQMVRTKVVTVKVDLQNREVLAALQKITGQSFGYNKRDWRLWLASSKTGTGVKTP